MRWAQVTGHLSLWRIQMQAYEDDSRVHILSIRLDRDDAELAHLAALLSSDEMERASRFHSDLDRGRYVAGRAYLRRMLGYFTGSHPADLIIQAGEHGKPYLVGTHRGRSLRFNVSHSGHLALIAVAWDRELGIDIERCKPISDHRQLAERFFSPVERQELRSLAAGEQLRAFYRCWTRKEAYIKALGDGLLVDLATFAVTFVAGAAPVIRWVAEQSEAESRWTLVALDVDPDFEAAICMEGSGAQLHFLVPSDL